MKQSRVFSSFLKQLLKTSPNSSNHFTTKSTIQSSVGIVFKCQTQKKYHDIEHLVNNWNEIKEVSVLMAQRAGYEKDLNAYNVVFPGGQADDGETDLQACKRELIEEVNLEVDKECIYVGKIPQNFYYAQKRGRYVYISCNIWLLKPQSKYEPKLNPDELIDYRWVPIRQLVDLDNLCQYDARSFGFFKRLPWKFLRQKTVHFPGLNVGMKRQLWGLTLWLVSYMLQMSHENIKSSLQSQDDKTLLSQIETITEQLKKIKITFKKTYPIGFPLTTITKLWHYKNRVQQFTYKKSIWQRAQTPLLVILVLTLITIIMVSLQ